ncbi:MAG: hypothetical protein V8R46_05305 [Eubacterium ramulus]
MQSRLERKGRTAGSSLRLVSSKRGKLAAGVPLLSTPGSILSRQGYFVLSVGYPWQCADTGADSGVPEIFEEENATIITTFDALMDRLVRPEVLRDPGFLPRLKAEDTLELEQLRQHLVGMGYESAYQVDAPGQFAVRGGIVDIFALTGEAPYRIELWGDEIDSIRTFDPDSQRSVDTLDEIVVYPAAELVLTKAQQEAGLKQITAERKAVGTVPQGNENRGSAPTGTGSGITAGAGGRI